MRFRPEPPPFYLERLRARYVSGSLSIGDFEANVEEALRREDEEVHPTPELSSRRAGGSGYPPGLGPPRISFSYREW